MLNTKQTQAITSYLYGKEWEHYGGALGSVWVVCRGVSHYFFFDDSHTIIKVITD